MEFFGPHHDILELRVLVPVIAVSIGWFIPRCSWEPGRYISSNLDGCPQKSWQFGVIGVPFGILNFAFSRLLLGEFITADQIVVFSHLTLIPSLFRDFSSTLFSVLANCMSCRAWTTAWHSYNLWFQTLRGSLWPLVTFHIMRIMRSSSWRIQGCQNGCRG